MTCLEVEFLRHFDFPHLWTRRIASASGPHFLPIQEKAIRAGLLEGRNLLASGPTSCGKSLVGDLACLNQNRRDRAGILIVPTKALARQRQDELRRRWAPLGLSVVQSSRDRREADGDIIAGRYHLAVIVAEKLLALLTQAPQLFAPVGAVVFDEFQMLFDEDRGADLELLATRLLREEQLQLIGLSSVLAQPAPLARWLNAELVEETERPVELRQGVLCQNRFYYREFNRERDGEEVFSGVAGDSEEELILQSALHFARGGEMTLVFCATKDESFAWAERFATALAADPAREAIEELDSQEDNLVTEALRRFLASRVAVHNADLTWPQRQLVEQFAARGDIRILCSTSTLSEGVNLPIVNTIVPRSIYRTCAEDALRGRPPRPERVTRSRFRNMTGRSGRLGHGVMPRDVAGEPFGRGVLVSPYQADVETLKRIYLAAEESSDTPQLLKRDLGPLILQLAATGSALSPGEIEDFLEGSLSRFLSREKGHGPGVPLAERIEKAIVELRGQGFLRTEAAGPFAGATGRIEIAALGQLAARSGILPQTLGWFRQWAQSGESLLEVEVLLAVAGSTEGQLAYLPLSRGEWRSRCHLNEMFRRLESLDAMERPALRRLFEYEDSSGQPFAVMLKKTLLLLDWISPQPSVEIERRYRVLTGHIEKLADQFAWLVESLAETAFIEGWTQEQCRPLERLARQLKAGLPASALALAPLYERGLNRTALIQLSEAGLETPGEVEDLSRAELVRVLGPAQANLLYGLIEEVPPPAELYEPKAVATDGEISLQGKWTLRLNRARPDRALLNGIEVVLTGKEFELLWVLASDAGKCISYDDLLDRVWPGTCVEQQQILHRKSRLLRKIEDRCGSSPSPLIRVVRGRGLYLDM